jgi:hypothetical protein
LVVVALLVAAPSVALADPTSDTHAAMNDYFDREQRGGYILIGMGAAGLVAGGLMYRASDLRLKGASYPLLGVGLLHVAAGIFVAVTSAKRVDTSRPRSIRTRLASCRARASAWRGCPCSSRC